MKNSKKFLVILMLVFMSSLFLVSCKKKDGIVLIPNYNLFKNAVYSFQYPSDWILTENGTNVTVTGPQVNAYFVNFKVDYNDQIDMSLDEFVKTVEEQNNLSAMPAFVDKGKTNIKLPVDQSVQRTFTTNVNTAFSPEPIMLLVTLTYLVQEKKIGYVMTTEVPNQASQNFNEIFFTIKNSFQYWSKIKK